MYIYLYAFTYIKLKSTYKFDIIYIFSFMVFKRVFLLGRLKICCCYYFPIVIVTLKMQ